MTINTDKQYCHVLLISRAEEARRVQIDSSPGSPSCQVEVVTDAVQSRAAILRPDKNFQIIIIDTQSLSDLSEWPNATALSLIQFFKNESPASDIILLIDKGQERAWQSARARAISYIYRPFNWDNLHLLVKHVVEHGQLKSVNHEKDILEGLMTSASKLLIGQEQQSVLDSILDGVVSTLYDRARLYLLSEDQQILVGKSQKGMTGNFVEEWRVDDYPHFGKLLENLRPHVFKREECDGPFRQWLEAEEVTEWGSVPLVVHNKVIGKISVDNKISQKPIIESDLEVVALFATQAAAVIDNSRLLESVKRRGEDLEAVLRLTSTINSSLDLSETLEATCKSAVDLLKVDHSGLLIFDADLKTGQVRAEFPHIGLKGGQIPISGIPAEELLIKTGEPIVIDDVDSDEARKSLGSVRDQLIRYRVKSSLIVLVKKGDRPLGSFSLETLKEKRHFTKEEVELCKNFAEQVGIAIENAQLYEEATERARQLEKLRETTLALNTLSNPEQLLDTIIEQGVKLLNAQSGGLYKRDPHEKTLTIIRDSLRPDNVGKKLCDGEGMAGQLANGKLPFKIIDDYSAWPERMPIFDDKSFGAVVEVPLVLKGEIIGVLYIDNPVDVKFKEEEARLLVMFAEYAAIVLDRVEQSHYLERLVASSPIGIIAADKRGKIKEFNTHAEELTQMSKADVLGEHVSCIYGESDEHRRIGDLLNHSREGRILNYETTLARRDLEVVPIRLSATWLYDANGEKVGSIGYFEDRRAADELRRSLRLLIEACTLMVEAEKPLNALQRFAELLVSIISFRYCRILLFNEDRSELVVKADYVAQRKGEPLWHGEIEKIITKDDLPELHALAGTRKTTILNYGIEEHEPVLSGLSSWMNVQLRQQKIRSLTIVPMNVGNQVRGILELGEVRGEHRNPITNEKLQLATAVVALSSAVIARKRLTEQLQLDLEHQNRATDNISSAFELADVMQNIVSEACRLFGANSSALWPYDDYQRRFIPEEMTAHGLSQEMQERLRGEESSPGTTASEIMLHGFLDVPDVERENLSPGTRMICAEEGIRSFRGILLKAGEDPVGVLYVNYKYTNGFIHRQELFENFALVSALSLKKARLLNQLSRAKKAAEGVAKRVTLGQRDQTLSLITEEIRNIVGCDLVTLYEYDQNKELLIQPPTIAGELLSSSSVVIREPGTNSLLFEIIQEEEAYRVPNTEQDALFSRSRFTREETIKSSVVIPLRLARSKGSAIKVGILFVNYRSPHRFSEGEIDTLTLFANQAAVALRNEQLYENVTRKGKYLSALHHASKIINESFDLQREQILGQIARQAYECLVSGRSARPSFAAIQLYDPVADTLTFESTYPYDALDKLSGIVGKTRSINPELAPGGKIGLTGRAVRTREVQLVKDVTVDMDHLVVIEGMRSELVVPLIESKEDRVLGVINVQSDRLSAFDQDDTDTLLALGELAVTAIKNVDLIDQLKRTNRDLGEANKRLLEVDRRRTEFFENVSHELSTPMTGIIATLENMLLGSFGKLDPRTKDRVEMALYSAYREEQIIKNLLNVQEIAQEPNIIKLTRESLAVLIKEEVKTFQYQIQQNGMQFSLYLSENDPLEAEVDRDKFRSIIMNLIGNALKFTPKGGQVSITGVRGDEWVKIIVEDNGCGISEEYHEMIFQRFYRIPEAPNPPGSGLGLHIVKTYVDLHRGEVGVESKVGHGSTFTVSLPIKQDRQDTQANAEEKESTGS